MYVAKNDNALNFNSQEMGKKTVTLYLILPYEKNTIRKETY